MSKQYYVTIAGILLLAVLFCSQTVQAQSPDVPDPVSLKYRGTASQYARGVLDGNLIETNFRNHGEVSRYEDTPWGVWPRGTGNRHIDGIGLYVLGRVWANRLKYPEYFPNAESDTVVAPTIMNFRPPHGRRSPFGPTWGWLPLPNFHNDQRIDPVTLMRNPEPAMSDDPSTWPESWPDKMDNPDDPGWSGKWNGYFGKGITQADLESYYVIDDHGDKEYAFNPATGEPYSPQAGIYYPSTQDSTIGGLGLMVKVRLLQWANILAEDTAFMLYEIVNRGGYDHGGLEDEGLYFMNVVDFGLGWDETDGVGEFDPQFDIAFGWDQSGDGPDATGAIYPVGYTGFAFLESPARPNDGQDNDEDGITDEKRDSGPGILIEGQDQIRSYVEANYNMADFESESAFGPLETQPAYIAGRWWTGDENLNWRSYDDANNNGQYDPGEFPYDDVGRDGLGPFNYEYEGPDQGELDGIPTEGEPSFDRLDIDESDQIGLRGFDLDVRQNYQASDNLTNDNWLWNRVKNDALFRLGTKRQQIIAGIEPYMMFVSGPINLPANSFDFFSLGWIFGSDREDFYRNRKVVQRIYNANYRFAQPPITPKLTATAGDERVTLAWDTTSINSFDMFNQEYDFEGYRIYRGTDPLMSDIRTISDVDGTPTFYEPIAQYDLKNGISGPVPVLSNRSVYNLGDDTGLKFFYVDSTVKNGVRYYYAVNAYDHGVIDTLDNGAISVDIDPQENTFNFNVDAFLQVRGTSRNAAVVTPKSRAAGYIPASTNEDVSKVTNGYGTGSIDVTIANSEDVIYDNIYRVHFRDSVLTPEPYLDYITTRYFVTEETSKDTLASGDFEGGSTPYIDGFFVNFHNDEEIEFNTDRMGWVGNEGSDNETFNFDPQKVDGYETNWTAHIVRSDARTADNFELRWQDQDVYYPPRYQPFTYLRDSLNILSINLDKSEQQGEVVPTELLILDGNDNSEFDVEDTLVVAEKIGTYYLRHKVYFTIPNGEESNPPKAGDVLRITNKRPFRDGDYFQFTVGKPGYDEQLAKDELENVKVVPNPYIATNIMELRSETQTSQSRSGRRIMFTNLPSNCTIRIYNIRGELIKTIVRNAAADNGSEYWNLLNRDNQDVAYGVYTYHVEAPGVGEKIGKFAIIK